MSDLSKAVAALIRVGLDAKREDWLELAMILDIYRPSARAIAQKVDAPVQRHQNIRTPPRPEFTCPRCLTPSWSVNDRRHGWCGRCTKFTADPVPDS